MRWTIYRKWHFYIVRVEPGVIFYTHTLTPIRIYDGKDVMCFAIVPIYDDGLYTTTDILGSTRW